MRRRLGRGARRGSDHQAVLRPLHAGDLGARLRAARAQARPARWTSWRCCDRERRGAAAAGARAPLAHALRGGLRHLAVRRGVAVGGAGASTCRCSTCCADGGAGDLTVTPVLADQLEARGPGGRALRGSCARSRAASTPRTPPGWRGGEHELAAELRRAAGDYERAAGGFGRRDRDCSPRSPGARRGRALDVGGHPRACCRCSPPTPGVRLQLATGIERPPARASAAGAAASGCPSAPTRRGWTPIWPTRACRPSASTRPTAGAARPAASPCAPPPGRWLSRSTGRGRAGLGRATATRPPPPTATTTA